MNPAVHAIFVALGFAILAVALAVPVAGLVALVRHIRRPR